MGLSGQQRKQLQSALIDAFPTTASLEQMLSFELDKSLRAIVSEGSLQDIVFKLIQTAVAEGWVEDLIRAAIDSNPGNSQLKAITEELPNFAPETPPSIPQKQSVQSQDKLNEQPIFDVFLAHNSQDKPQVRKIAQELRRRRLNPWLDEEQIQPGRPFQDEIEQAIPLVRSAAIFFGQQGLGRWQVWELRSLINQCVRRQIPVIPLLLPGVNELPENLLFLQEFRWVCFSNNLDDEQALSLLQWGITGERPTQLLNSTEKPGHVPTSGNLQKSSRLIVLIQEFWIRLVNFVIGSTQPLSNPSKLMRDEVGSNQASTQLSQLQNKYYERDEVSSNQTSTQLSQLQNKYYEWLISKYRNSETEGLSLLGSLSLSDVFVPLKVAANYKTNARSEMIPLRNYDINSPKTIWNFLVAATGDKLTLKQSSIVVLGAPGSGKTTLLKYLAYVYAKQEQKKHFENAPELIPVLLLIREIYQEIIEKQPPLINFIAKHIKFEKKNQTTRALSKWFVEQLNKNKCLIMLDGLDEVADETQRSLVRNWIDKQINSFSKNVFILTSRPRGYKEASLKNVGIVLEVQPFKIEQVCDFIHKWYLAIEKIRLIGDSIDEQAKRQAEDLITRIRNSPPLASMAVNPLLLTMISMVHHQLSLENRKLPERRVDLYKEMCEVLLEKRQKEKNISDKLIGKDKQSVLQVLALKLMQQTDSEQQTATEFEISQGICWIEEPLATKVSNEVQPEQFVEYICSVSGLLVEKELKYYQFAHLSFQEYLAATQISELDQENLLISNITKSWWAETIRLYAAQSDATELIRAVIDMQSPSVDVMALAYDCLKECLRVDENVRRQLLQKLEEGLESTDPELFKLAAQVSLIRRFRNFIRINEELEIDKSYITCAEYQLFLDETGESRQPQHWQSNRFSPGDAKETITGISRENALRFCGWLGEWYRTRLGNQLSEMAVHYRLPEKEEINQYSINDDRQFSESGVRLVKFLLPSRYSKLAEYLWSGEWEKADEKTANLMLQVGKRELQGFLNVEDIENFPCDDLGRIDFLWVYASKGHFGFSVQKNIYQSVGGTGEYNEKLCNNFGDLVGWRVNQRDWISYSEVTSYNAPVGHLPRRWVWWFRFGMWGVVSGNWNLGMVSSLASKLVDCNL